MTTGGPDPARYREMNRAMVQRLRGSAPPPLVAGTYELRVLRTTGRASGQERPVPLAVVHHDDRRYLVAPDARRDWVANLDADPRAGIEAGGGVEEVRVTRVAGRPAAHVVAAYAAAATGPARAAFPFGDDPDISEVEAVLDRMAVFEVVGGPA
jgi:deazaflavin-dependent oxidoreductase (nitroreductase family)